MKTLRWHVLASVLFASVAFADIAGAGQWESLFNGKDLTGWVVMNNAVFTVTNGVIHLDKSTGWLRTEKEYADFILEVDWRGLETNYNSGIFIRAGLEGKPHPTNVWQINLKETAPGQLLRGKPEVLPSKTTKFPVNEWVNFRIEARGKKLTLDVNGARAWEFDGLDADRGYIGLQAEGKRIEFRHLRVQELPASGVPNEK
ncbi:MAG TPA: DUF1080 domain-containing protein [Verrucomicrobiae bacterium]|nr:DUF1080 domain-containing protein [Verrucomicrobiae bacterium]